MVAMQVRVDDEIHRIAGPHIGVVHPHIGLQMRTQLLVQVARPVAPVGMRSRPHPRVHQDDVLAAFEQKHPVVQLQLPVLQRILVRRPRRGRHVREHRRQLPRRRHHIDDRGDFHIADGCLVCHCGFPSSNESPEMIAMKAAPCQALAPPIAPLDFTRRYAARPVIPT